MSSIKIGGIYTLARRNIGGLNYSLMYDEGNFINVRVLEACHGLFRCTTRGEDGKHLGPGGGWDGSSQIMLPAKDLEPLKTK